MVGYLCLESYSLVIGDLMSPCIQASVILDLTNVIDTCWCQGWQVCDELVITASKNTVITDSSQTAPVIASCHKH